jgi:hypothetical protein
MMKKIVPFIYNMFRILFGIISINFQDLEIIIYVIDVKGIVILLFFCYVIFLLLVANFVSVV